MAKEDYPHYVEFADPITEIRHEDGRSLVRTTGSAYWLIGLEQPVEIADRRLLVKKHPTAIQPAITYTAPPPKLGSQ